MLDYLYIRAWNAYFGYPETTGLDNARATKAPANAVFIRCGEWQTIEAVNIPHVRTWLEEKRNELQNAV